MLTEFPSDEKEEKPLFFRWWSPEISPEVGHYRGGQKSKHKDEIKLEIHLERKEQLEEYI